MKESSQLVQSKKQKSALRKLPKALKRNKHQAGEGLAGHPTAAEGVKNKLISIFSQQNWSSKKLILSCALGFTFITIFGLLLFSNLYYKDKILPKTKIGSLTLSTNPEAASQELSEAVEQYELKLDFKDQRTSQVVESLGLHPDLDSTVEAAKNLNNQISFLKKPFALLSSHDISLVSNLEQKTLEDFLISSDYAEKIPADARIDFDQGSENYVIIPEISGRGVDLEELSKELSETYSKLSPEEVKLNVSDIQPKIKASNITEVAERANSIIRQRIVIKTPLKNYSPSVAQMKDWLSLSPQPESGNYSISFNKDAQKAYIDSVVERVNRNPKPKVIADINSQQILIQPGSSGYSAEDYTGVLESLNQIVPGASGGELTIKFEEIAPGIQNIAASGGRWIFADLSEYSIYAYEGANQVNSFLMSSGARSTPTPTGNFSVSRKVRVKTMTSGGNPNSPDYYSVPNIEWVAYFKSGGYAMHGVYWHNKFGLQNTSHGCMGMSNPDAHWVYDFVSVGTPVVVVQ